jgi:hypothetical protein
MSFEKLNKFDAYEQGIYLVSRLIIIVISKKYSSGNNVQVWRALQDRDPKPILHDL